MHWTELAGASLCITWHQKQKKMYCGNCSAPLALYRVWRWSAILPHKSAKVLDLLLWPITTRHLWLFKVWMGTHSETVYYKCHSKPTTASHKLHWSAQIKSRELPILQQNGLVTTTQVYSGYNLCIHINSVSELVSCRGTEVCVLCVCRKSSWKDFTTRGQIFHTANLNQTFIIMFVPSSLYVSGF